MDKFKTEQEKFWAGDFGNEYTNRNQGKNLFSSNIALFSKILSKTNNVESIIEFGANIGINLIAIKYLLQNIKLSAVEINKEAVKELNLIKDLKVYHDSILNFFPDCKYDFVFTRGVLIHMNPEKLYDVYNCIYNSSRRYICVIEYYNPVPIEINYRGHSGKLFKRDFAGEMLNRWENLSLIDYGFIYHRDNCFPQDDLNWFLLEKK